MNMLSIYCIVLVACLGWLQECDAFAPRLYGKRAPTLLPVGTSIGGRYYGNNANQTAMDVLESLDFIANIKHQDSKENGGVPLFEATREVVEDDDIISGAPLESTLNVESVATPVDSITVMDKRAAEFEAVLNGDLDVLHKVSAINNNGKKRGKKNKKNKDKKQTDSEDAIAPTGIGGSGGTVYNVNRLKKNLVQEMVKSYKTEMWHDLGDPAVNLAVVEDKLASLVQSNAVKCTTDSNLLEGTWTFAFQSRQSAATLMESNRFDIAARRNTKTTPKAKSAPGPFSSYTKTFALENLEDNEDAYVLDRTRSFGGMVSKLSTSKVSRLTRTSLLLEPSIQQTYVLGKRIRTKQSKNDEMKDLRILYVDNDLCLSTTGDLETSPFFVYTKSQAWVGRTQGMKRGARRLVGGLKRVRSSLLNILFLRRRIRKAVVAKVTAADDSNADKILVDNDDLTVLKLGDLENDANAWEGEEDPFVHLSADERQEQLKKMRVRDVRRAGRKQKRRNSRGKKSETRKPFKKPE